MLDFYSSLSFGKGRHIYARAVRASSYPVLLDTLPGLLTRLCYAFILDRPSVSSHYVAANMSAFP